jgi:hypothetical protein
MFDPSHPDIIDGISEKAWRCENARRVDLFCSMSGMPAFAGKIETVTLIL